MCKQDFEHSVIHKFVMVKRFCDSCAKKRRYTMVKAWCKNMSSGKPVGRPKKPLEIMSLPKSIMTWETEEGWY